MALVTVAATQMACTWDIDGNVARAEKLVREAAAKGAQIILIQELFQTPYFCIDQSPEHFDLAQTIEDSPLIQHFSALAKELDVVLPLSFFERAGNAHYNSLVMIDADGEVLDVYRKTHIPNGPAYQEKQFFTPGDTGFIVWETKYANVGVGICWDQWFPESARCMALMGAELLLYPTAIGSEPLDADVDSKDHWQMCMRGHAAANLMPVIASNRIGKETQGDSAIAFYGSSFIAGPQGNLLTEADRVSESVILHAFDLDAIAFQRAEWGVFRDRRPELYKPMLTLDGESV